MQHAKKCDCMMIPSEQDAALLVERVKQGDAIAMERVAKLHHNMVVPTTAPERVVVSLIIECYLKHIKPFLHEII